MPLQKNQVLTLTIERLSNDGSGVAHSPDGEAVFVPGTAPGDEADIRIVKDCGRYAFGILDTLRTPSPDRIPVDCAVAGPCGGCSLRHLDYAAELRAKQENVVDAFRRIDGLPGFGYGARDFTVGELRRTARFGHGAFDLPAGRLHGPPGFGHGAFQFAGGDAPRGVRRCAGLGQQLFRFVAGRCGVSRQGEQQGAKEKQDMFHS